jgi:hypothetical protein
MHGRSRHVDQGDLSGIGWVNRGRAQGSQPGRSQSPHRSKEVPETGWSKGGQGGGCVKYVSEECSPVQVPKRAKQAGEARVTKWNWVEPSVWTKRMLEALEKGVKGGVWLISRGRDHNRWPNSFFREHGLFSLEDAHRALLQSSLR